MAISKWVYALATGQFTRGGFFDPAYDPATEGVAEFEDAEPNPNPRLERFDATLGKRPATDTEIAAYDADQADRTARANLDQQKAIRATVIWALTRILGTTPTPAQIDTARTQWLNIFKSLG
jgi:hypothetical protein